MIELIEKQSDGWHIRVDGVDCFFTGKELYMGNNIFPVKPNADNGLRWRVNRVWISYRKIKSIIT